VYAKDEYDTGYKAFEEGVCRALFGFFKGIKFMVGLGNTVDMI